MGNLIEYAKAKMSLYMVVFEDMLSKLPHSNRMQSWFVAGSFDANFQYVRGRKRECVHMESIKGSSSLVIIISAIIVHPRSHTFRPT